MNINIKNMVNGTIIVISSDKNGRDIYTRHNFAGSKRISERQANYEFDNNRPVVIDNR